MIFRTKEYWILWKNKVDSSTGTIRVRAVLDNSDRRLTPGLFVRVCVPASEPKQALLVAENALGSDRDKKFLLVADKDNVAQYHQVRLDRPKATCG